MPDPRPEDQTVTLPNALSVRAIGPYAIEAKLGEGGMGVVYRGYDARLRRRVAIKMLKGDGALDDTQRERFQREARAASALNHPHICTVFDVGEDRGAPYLVLEHLEGETLRERIGRGPLAVEEIRVIVTQVREALEAAHSRGIVHRDIKPANIFLTSPAPGKIHAKVMDFGLAKILHLDADASTLAMLTEAGVAAGTVAYMSPEQARGEELDAATDWFSLGVVLYEMAAGRRPFTGSTTAALFDGILNRDPAPLASVRPDLPPDLLQLTEQWLRKDRRLRSTSAPVTPPPQVAKPAPIARAVWLKVAAVAAVVIAAAAFVRWGPAPEVHSIAVTPFTGQGPDAEFAAGLSVAFSDDLQRIKGLRVIPRAAANADADAALSGRIDAGTPATLHAELKLKNGSQLWQQDYSFDRGTLYQTQRRVIEDVRAAIGQPAPPTQRPGREPKNNEAYDLYLRARSHTTNISEPELDKAIDLLERARALDPQFVGVDGYLAFAYGSKAFSYKPNDIELDEKGMAAVQRAFAIDPDAPEAHYGLSQMLWRPNRGFPHRDALASLRKCLAQLPDFDEAWHQHAMVLSHVGHVAASIRDLEQAIRVNPANTMARARRGVFLIYEQKFQEAVDQLDQTPHDIFPNWPYQRAWALLSLNRLDDARKQIDDTMKLNRPDQGGTMRSARAMLRALTGDRRGAEADIADAIKVGEGFGHFHHTAYSIGAVYSVLGDVQKAHQWIERAANTGFPCYSFFENDPFLANARKSEPFQALLKKMRAEWENIPGEQ